jgi:hypothetical protein
MPHFDVTVVGELNRDLILYGLSASISPAQPPAVRVRKSASLVKGTLKIVTVTSWPSVSSSFSSGSRMPPE